MGYKVKLPLFEGPFDLLVYLIENARMNIYDIRVSEITAQYLDYIEQMQQMDVTVSSEFMVLAAELIELKSRMLLPRSNPETGEVVAEDPRTELVARILEYKTFKTLSGYLAEREEHGFMVREKPQEDISQYLESPDEYLSLEMDQFVQAFNAFLLRKKRVSEIRSRYERIEREKVTAEARIAFIESLLRQQHGNSLNFKETVKEGDRYDTALSFSSMLEMIRQKKLTAEQKALFADIYLKEVRE